MTRRPDRPGPRTAVGGRAAVLAVIGLLIGIGVPELGLGRRLAPGHDLPSLLVHEAVWWALVAVMIGYILFVERRSLSSIGLKRPNWQTFVFAVPVGVLMVAIIITSYALVFPALGVRPNVKAMSEIARTPFWYRLLLVARAAVSEEIVYRAYPIERVTMATGSRLAGLVFSIIAFSLAHLSSWGWAQLIPVTLGGLLLGAYYLWRRDLVSNMVAHFVADGSGFLLT